MKKFYTFLTIIIPILLIHIHNPANAQLPFDVMEERVRIVLETEKHTDIGDLLNKTNRLLEEKYRIKHGEFKIEKLFPDAEKSPNFDLGNFFFLTIPGKKYYQLEKNTFDIGYYLRRGLNLASAEPDLPYTKYYPLSGKCMEPSEKLMDRGWSLRNMNVPKAWKLKPKNSGKSYGDSIRIGHPDTGYNHHVDLDRTRLKPEIGYDYVDNDQDPKDPLDYHSAWENAGHGIATGSVIISKGTVEKIPDDNEEGGTGEPGKVTGVAPKAHIVPIRALKSVIRIFSSNVSRAIYHAANKNCRIISLSLGGLPSRALRASLEYAIDRNLIVIAAAGNCEPFVVYPARYDFCIAVAASNSKDKPWKGTAHGTSVAISAPGEYVWRAKRNKISDPINIAEGGQGTSYSTASIAGIAALWLAYHNPENLSDKFSHDIKLQFVFKQLLKRTAKVPPGWNANEYGDGIVNAFALLKKEPTKIKESARKDTLQFLSKRKFAYLDLLASVLGTDDFFDENLEKWGAELLYILMTESDIRNKLINDFKRIKDNRKRVKIMAERMSRYASESLNRNLR